MNRTPSPPIVSDPARILLLGLRREERECLERELGADPRYRLEAVDSVAQALPRVPDALLADLDSYLFLQRHGEGGQFGPGGLPALVLVSPGEERHAADWLEREPAEFLLRAGDYRSLLPVWVRRLLHRREARWEEVAALLRHEINNPLTGLLGNAELLLAEAPGLPDRARRRLDTIIQLALRLRDVVRNLEAQLDRGESGPETDCRAADALHVPRPLAR